MDNSTLRINPDTHDLELTEEGSFIMIHSDNTSAQCVRLTLETFKSTFFLDLNHGTDYAKIMGEQPTNKEIDTIMSEAIYQEPNVRHIDALSIGVDGRLVNTSFSARLKSGQTINVEVGV
ncbi:hypothetical protein LJC42_06940 [Eubacteriales bacterium OttesenSCG-928-K08]|nr:hypothetical protein [Eubacteriales bacterium OttesenSCG-928-K08]